ncbi:MAG: WYL domain-containing protein [Planctomycetaceae bacterium]|nr:WYL domain-containing protein [Planctomycetaceae bacterium]
MARNDQLIRQHKLLQILERTRFGYTLNELRDSLIDELGLTSLHTRTLRRDIEALQSAGLDIVSRELERGRVWLLGETGSIAYQINATATELLALSVGRDLLNPLNGTFIGEGITSFWNRVREAVPDNIWQHYERVRQIMFVSGTPVKSYESHRGILKTLERAIIQHRWCRIGYSSLSHDPSQRQISPRAIVFYNASLYVIAEETGVPDQIRHWKLDRIQNAEILDRYFEPRENDYHEYLETGIGIFANDTATIYEIVLSSSAAKWVQEEPWHPDQKLTPMDDAKYSLLVPGNHDMEIIPRVLALGQHAQIVAPESCRAAMIEIIQALLMNYGAGSSDKNE